MSEASEKTEEPTPQRLRKAREQGDLPFSGTLTQTAALIAALALLPASAQAAVAQFRALLQQVLSGPLPSPFELAAVILVLTAPMLLSAATAALAFGFVQTQGQVALVKLTPKLSNLDPIEGLKKLFKADRLFQVARAMLLATIVTWLSVDLISGQLSSLAASVGNLEAAQFLSATLVRRLLWITAGVSVALAAVDVLITRQQWLKRNRMSKDEIKREHKESEGDPQIKQQRRRAHQEMLNQASVLSIKDATVLIVNPTHIATALRYADDESNAPTLIAKGQGVLARQLMDAARAYGVPIVRDVPVARALHELELGDEIPELLYEAVAEILREAWAQDHPDDPPDSTP